MPSLLGIYARVAGVLGFISSETVILAGILIMVFHHRKESQPRKFDGSGGVSKHENSVGEVG